ncbi:BamA/TamA family outer membrane protein [Gangjinia marincola]|uniref:BamA/TamA family outer membrane protein n=1 Tax=Gangjinia marincola TaxID=578463 RepID=A0ABN1MF46_9FLAO
MGLSSCSVERFIPEGEYLYTSDNVEVVSDTVIKDKGELKNALTASLIPATNNKFLGMYPGLYFHYKAQREKPGFINKFLNNKFGKEPVYLSDVEPYQVEDLIRGKLENNGFFYSVVASDVKRDTANKEASVDYRVKLLNPYLLKSYQLDTDTMLIYSELKKELPGNIIKDKMRFDLSALKAERERLERELRSKGYYHFNAGLLIFEADTNQYDTRRFDLFLRLKNKIPEKSTIPYKIKTVNIYPHYSVEEDSLSRKFKDRYAEKNYFQKEVFFKPKRLDPFILIEEGDLYSPKKSSNTSRRLSSIGLYKFINIEYNELDTNPSDSLGLLEANIYLSPLNKRSLRAELKAVTKSNNFAGPNFSTSYTNRNLFGGGEILDLSANVGYEVQLGSTKQNLGTSSLLLGVESKLTFPRMILPFTINTDWFDYAIPKTVMSLGAEYLNRSQLFSLTSLNAKLGYLWQANRYVTHEFFPVESTYVNLGNVTTDFQEVLDDNEFLQRSFDQQFISGMRYSFTYNGMVDTKDTHQFYFNFNLDTAGNSLSLFSGGGSPDDPATIFGLQYSQYAKADVDVRYHFKFAKRQKIATRLFAGYGKPYGNSDVLPYLKQYFSGGPYSVRAFQIRSLGPGTYTPEDGDQTSFYDQAGNIRLEANIEYRFPLFNFVNGAVFGDAGNVWNAPENTQLSGSRFESDFINELGIGVGTGIRIDIQSFVIRFDLAAPIHDPQLDEGERWDFRWDEPVFNFAIGYPF